MDRAYFWKIDRVCLRPLHIEDAERKCQEWLDTQTRRFLEYQLDLPPVSLAEYTEQLKDACEFKETSRTINFAIDNLNGEFVGWINFFKGRARQQLTGTPHGLLRDIFAYYLNILDSDPADTARQKIEAGLVNYFDEELQMKTHFIGALLGFDFSNSPHLRGVLDDPEQSLHA